MFTPMEERLAASRRSFGGTMSGTSAWNAGSWMAETVPSTNVDASRTVVVV